MSIRRFHILAVLIVIAVFLIRFWPLIAGLRYLAGVRLTDALSVDPPAFLIGFHKADANSAYIRTWFHGPWVAQNEFFRPLASLAFYGMYRAFGPRGMEGFCAVQLASHLAACLLALGFLSAIFSGRVALIATVTFTLGLTECLGLPAPTDALRIWIDCVEPWTACAILGCAWFFAAYLATGKRTRLAASIACLVIALGFKELAYVVPLIIAWCLAVRGRLRDWKLILPYAAVCAAALVYRTILFHGRGAYYGSNDFWPRRLAQWFGGIPASQAANDNLDSFVVAAFLFSAWAIVHAFRIRTPKAMVLAASSAVAFVVLNYMDATLIGAPALMNTARFFVPRLHQVVPDALSESLPLAGILGLWYSALCLKIKPAAYGILFAAITYLPLLTAPILSHALYLSALGWSLTIAASIDPIIPKNSAEETITPGTRA